MGRIILKYILISPAFFAPLIAQAAVLYVQPSPAGVAVGSTVAVSVLVDTEGSAINNAEGVLSFSKDIFDVVSINKDASLFSLWIQAPSYDGNNSISFNGGLPSPGYQGSNGRLFTVTLRAKAAGTGIITLDNAAVRANDGLGTNVMRNANGSTVAVQPAASAPPTAAPAQETPPAASPNDTAIAISSPTHPSQDAWYSQTHATLMWDLPAGADAVQTLLSPTQGATPTVTYRPAIGQKVVDNLEDGVWYFNLRAHTKSGWGPTSSYKLQIDTTPPTLSGVVIVYDPVSSELVLSAAAANSDASDKISLSGAAADSLSGLSKIAVIVDGEEITSIPPNKLDGKTYTVPVTLQVGMHDAQLRVTDAAGNSTDSSESRFEVLQAPTFMDILRMQLGSFDTGGLLLILTLLLSCFSVLMNIVLWKKLHRYERQEGKNILPVSKIQRDARQKLLALRKDLQKQARELERAHGRQDITPNDAAYLKKIREHLAETELFLGQKIKDVEKR
jgi:hypothetical protein